MASYLLAKQVLQGACKELTRVGNSSNGRADTRTHLMIKEAQGKS